MWTSMTTGRRFCGFRVLPSLTEDFRQADIYYDTHTFFPIDLEINTGLTDFVRGALRTW